MGKYHACQLMHLQLVHTMCRVGTVNQQILACYILYLANSMFSLIFVASTYVNYVDRILHRWGRREIL